MKEKMRYLVLSVDKFTYKDKITGLPTPANVVYAMNPDGKVIKPFFGAEEYAKFPFDSLVLNKADVESLHKDYKVCDIEFNEFGRILSVVPVVS